MEYKMIYKENKLDQEPDRYGYRREFTVTLYASDKYTAPYLCSKENGYAGAEDPSVEWLFVRDYSDAKAIRQVQKILDEYVFEPEEIEVGL